MFTKIDNWDIENLQKLDRKSKEWVRFVHSQELRIQTQLTKYNNIEAVRLQHIEEVYLTPNHEYKLVIIVKILSQTLDRIREGKYGKCITCNHDIPAKRLFLIPSVTKCINCENNLSQMK